MTEHGTRSRYRHDGCRCPRCVAAMRADAKVQNALRTVRRGGEPGTHVRAGHLAAELRALHADGWSWSAIGAGAGIAPSSAWRAARDDATVRWSTRARLAAFVTARELGARRP